LLLKSLITHMHSKILCTTRSA